MGEPTMDLTGQAQDVSKRLEELKESGIQLDDQGQFRESLEVFEQALKLVEQHFGTDHLEAAPIYLRLAMILQELEKWDQAFEYHVKSVAIYQRELGENDSFTARAHNNFGIYHWRRADYPAALESFNRARVIHEHNHGPNHSLVADTIENIGMIYYMFGDPVRAAEMTEQSARIKETALGKLHTSTAQSYNNAGAYHLMAGNLERARESLVKALEIRRVLHSPEHPYVTSTLDNLGQLEQEVGNLDLALEYYQLALDGNRKTYGEHHNETGRVLNNLGSLMLLKNQPEQALHYLELALASYESLGGIGYLDIVFNLAQAHRNLERLDQAIVLQTQALRAFLDFQARAFSALDTQSKVQYNTQARRWLGLYFECVYAVQSKSKTSPHVLEALTFWLTFKGSASAFETTLALAQEHVDESTRTTLDSFQATQSEYAQYALQTPETAKRQEYLEHLGTLRSRVSALEQALSQKLMDFQNALALRELSANDLLEVLNPNEAYADYALAGDHLYAFLISPDHQVRLHDLGSSVAANAVLEAFRHNLATNQTDDKSLDQVAFSILIQPLGSQLKGAQQLVVVPDGSLHFVPFDLLNDGTAILLAQMEIRNIPSGRDLIRLRRTRQSSKPSPAVLFGDPDFLSRVIGKTRSAQQTDQSGNLVFGDWLQALSLPRLPATRHEVKMIKQCLPEATIFLGEHANQDNLFAVKSPEVLHLATHAFVYGGDDVPNPMLRAFVCLTGARLSLLEKASDGLISALRLSTLNLKNTKLVVLSACRSALGQIRNGEGVAGLNQALFSAGAQCVISGLWAIPDDETAEFIAVFYRQLANGKTSAMALRDAKLEYSQHHTPHQWAGFILNGESIKIESVINH